MRDKILLLPWALKSWCLRIAKKHSAGSAGTTMVGNVELLYRLSWWPDDRSHGISSSPIHPPDEVPGPLFF